MSIVSDLEFDVSQVLKESLQKIVEEAKSNNIPLFKSYIPALFEEAINSVDYWAIGQTIDISEKCILGEVGEVLQKIFADRQAAKKPVVVELTTTDVNAVPAVNQPSSTK